MGKNKQLHTNEKDLDELFNWEIKIYLQLVTVYMF